MIACCTVAIVFRRISQGVAETEEKRILVIADDGDDPHRSNDIRRHIDIRIFVVRFRPVTAARIDIETEDGLIGAPFQPFVDPTDLGAVGILQLEDRGAVATEVGLNDLNPAVSLRPGKNGLNIKALPYCSSSFAVMRSTGAASTLSILSVLCTGTSPAIGVLQAWQRSTTRRDRRHSSSR